MDFNELEKKIEECYSFSTEELEAINGLIHLISLIDEFMGKDMHIILLDFIDRYYNGSIDNFLTTLIYHPTIMIDFIRIKLGEIEK